MKAHEVLQQAIEPVGVKAIAHQMRLNSKVVEEWCSPEGGEPSGLDPLMRTNQMTRLTRQTTLLSWLCGKTGGYFVPNPPPHPGSPIEVLQVTQKMVSEFSLLLDVVARSVPHQPNISREDSASIRDIWQSLKSTAESFVNAAEMGRYGPGAQG